MHERTQPKERKEKEEKMLKLIQGDCLEEMKKIPDGSVNLVLTDPPYGMNYQSARRTDKSLWKPKIANDKLPFIWFLHEASKKLKEGGALISFCRFDSWSDFSRACELAGLEVKMAQCSIVLWVFLLLALLVKTSIETS